MMIKQWIIILCAFLEADSLLRGKAYIISTSFTLNPHAAYAAAHSGFNPELFAALRPFDLMFGSNKQFMYEQCVGISHSDASLLISYQQRTLISGFTTSEMALVCSHRQILELVSNDEDAADSSWSLILEDDANLHPALNSSIVYDIVTRSLQKIDEISPHKPAENGFVYFGMCRGHCKKVGLDGVLGNDCCGLCTHAYAVTKAAAKVLPQLVYSHKLLNDSRIKIDSDQALLDYFEKRGHEVHAHLIGHHLYYHESNQHIRGVIVQGKSRKKGFHSGTSLHSNGFVPMYCAHFDHSLSIDVSTLSSMRSIMHHHPTMNSIHTFGLGDALFVYASLSALCALRNTHPDYCLSSFIANPNNLSAVIQLRQVVATHLPKQVFRCPPPPISNSTHTFLVDGYNAKVLSQPPGTLFSGRFHSYRYFEGSPAIRMLQERLRFSLKIDQKSEEMFLSDSEAIATAVARREQQHLSAENVSVVCISMDSHFRPSDFYLAAMTRFRRRLFHHKRGKVPLFLVFDEPSPPRIHPTTTTNTSSTAFLTGLLHFSSSNNQSVNDDGGQRSGYLILSATRKADLNPNNYSNSRSSEGQWLRRVSQCRQLVVSGSSLSWWAAWAAGLNAHVMAPTAPLSHTHYNLPRWTVL